MLVAAFRATLEEVVEADVIVHVRDISQADSDAEKHDVETVLRQLDIDPADENRLIEVWNKIDKLDDVRREQLANMSSRQSDSQRGYPLSAETGEGVDALLQAIEMRLAAAKTTFDLVVDAGDGAGVSWLHQNTEVIEKTLTDGHFAMTVRVDDTRVDIVTRRFIDKTGSH
jgi:GTP-binding protein HflX